MTQSQLIQHISAVDEPYMGMETGNEPKQEGFTLQELVDLTFYTDKTIAVKASRVLETMLVKFPENHCDEIEYFIKCTEQVDYPGCAKHYARIIAHITSPEVPREVRSKVKEINFERVIELCFGWMKDAEMLVSVRASASEALFNLRHRYPWIAEDLSRQLQLIVPTADPLLLAKGNLILSYLHCED